jgi:LexA-binding, inner membrane-associated putative hydrolase
MFLAHLPAGYLVGAVITKRWPLVSIRTAWCAVLLGSIAPDLDLFYFYMVSDRSINHHIYPTHLPVVWLLTSIVVGLCLWRAPPRWRATWAMFSSGWFLHLLLDTVAGHIWWLWPWVTTPYVLIVVPRRFDLWWLNFLAHPSILIEMLIIACAAVVWHRRRTNAVVKKRVDVRTQFPQRPYRTFL